MSETKNDTLQRLKDFWKGFSTPTEPERRFYNAINVAISELRRSRTRIDEKINEASDSLKRTSQVVEELEQILTERSEKLTMLRKEYERYSELSKLSGEESEAVCKELEIAINKGKKQERWVGFLLNIGAGLIIFIVGVVYSPTVSEWFGVGKTPASNPQVPVQNK